jgi:hypothetical protein
MYTSRELCYSLANKSVNLFVLELENEPERHPLLCPWVYALKRKRKWRLTKYMLLPPSRHKKGDIPEQIASYSLTRPKQGQALSLFSRMPGYISHCVP